MTQGCCKIQMQGTHSLGIIDLESWGEGGSGSHSNCPSRSKFYPQDWNGGSILNVHKFGRIYSVKALDEKVVSKWWSSNFSEHENHLLTLVEKRKKQRRQERPQVSLLHILIQKKDSSDPWRGMHIGVTHRALKKLWWLGPTPRDPKIIDLERSPAIGI